MLIKNMLCLFLSASLFAFRFSQAQPAQSENGTFKYAPLSLKFRPLETVDQRFRPLDHRGVASAFFIFYEHIKYF